MDLPLIPTKYFLSVETTKTIEELTLKFEKETKDLKYHSFYTSGENLILEEQIMNRGGVIANLSWEGNPNNKNGKLLFDSHVCLEYGSNLVLITVVPAIIVGFMFLFAFINTLSIKTFTFLLLFSLWYLFVVIIVRFRVSSFIDDLKYLLK